MNHKRDIKYSGDNGYPWEAGSNVNFESKKPVDQPEVTNFGELIYGQPLKWYSDIASWPMFIILVIEIGLRVMQTKYYGSTNPLVFNTIIDAVRLAMFIYLSLIAVKQFKATKKQVYTSAVLGGLVAGFILAIFQLFWYFELWTFFNLIGQPLLLAAEGLVISWLIVKIFFRNKISK